MNKRKKIEFLIALNSEDVIFIGYNRQTALIALFYAAIELFSTNCSKYRNSLIASQKTQWNEFTYYLSYLWSFGNLATNGFETI